MICKKFILWIILISLLSCTKGNNKSNYVKVNRDKKDLITKEKDSILGQWFLRKKSLAWDNEDEIITNDNKTQYILYITKDSIIYHSNKKNIIFKGTYSLKLDNTKNELGKYLLNCNYEEFHSCNFLNDSFIIYGNSEDSNTYFFYRF